MTPFERNALLVIAAVLAFLLLKLVLLWTVPWVPWFPVGILLLVAGAAAAAFALWRRRPSPVAVLVVLLAGLAAFPTPWDYEAEALVTALPVPDGGDLVHTRATACIGPNRGNAEGWWSYAGRGATATEGGEDALRAFAANLNATGWTTDVRIVPGPVPPNASMLPDRVDATKGIWHVGASHGDALPPWLPDQGEPPFLFVALEGPVRTWFEQGPCVG